MRIFWFFLALSGFSIPVVFLAFLYESDVFEERTIEINRRRADCFEFVSNLENQREINYFQINIPQIVFEATPKSATWSHQAKEFNSNIRVLAEWTNIVKTERLDFRIRVDLGFAGMRSIPLSGSCGFEKTAITRTKITCHIKGKLTYVQKFYLPQFISDDNTADPFTDTLTNLKLHLERNSRGL